MQHALAADTTHETSTGIDNRKLLMWVFLASECLFFGGLIGTYLLDRARGTTPPVPRHPRAAGPFGPAFPGRTSSSGAPVAVVVLILLLLFLIAWAGSEPNVSSLNVELA